MKKFFLFALLICMIVATSAVNVSAAAKNGPEIIIGSKTFTENILLGRITYDYLNYLGYPVEEQLGFGEMAFLRAALESGKLSLYWEYTGTILMAYMQHDPIYDPIEAYKAVKAWDKEKHQVAWLDMSSINDTYALVMNPDTQKKYGTTKISEMAELIKKGERITIAGTEEGWARPDVYLRLENVYGYTYPDDAKIVVNANSITVEVVRNGEADTNLNNSTDPRNIKYGLIILEDDKQAFPPYHAVISIRQDILDAYPDLEADLNRLNAALNEPIIVDLISRVDLDGQQEDVVSKNWLQSVGLIK
jgi:osmoprotectant transport system substrate-binding protein